MNSLISYGAFCGGAGLILGVIGLAAMFFDGLKGIIVLGLDGIASFFLLAGGLVSSTTPHFYISSTHPPSRHTLSKPRLAAVPIWTT